MRLLVTGAWQSAKEYLEPLRKQGHEVVFQQQEKDPLACPGEWVEGIICNGLFLHHDLEEFPNLRYLQLTSAGLDRIPLEEKKTYITDLDRKMMQYIMSDFKDLQYVFDKAATYEKFGRYYQRDEISVASSADFETFREFAGKHEDLVIKQVSASCGQGITIEKVNRG